MISVIIPTRHRTEELSKCLELLAPYNQKLNAEDYEVIVTDDGSSLDSFNLIQNSFSWVHWVAGPKKGPAANRNNGAQSARGTHFVFTDDDCLPTSDWLSAYVAAIKTDIPVYEGKTICNDDIQGPYMFSPVNLEGGRLWSCNIMVNREAFQKLGGFDEAFTRAADEDTDFYKRLKNAGLAVEFVAEAIVEHPAVRRPWGRHSAPLWESKVRLWHKHGELKKSEKEWGRLYFSYVMLQARLGLWRNSSFNWDSLTALLAIPIEILWAVRHLETWHKRHRNSSHTSR